MNNLHKDKDLEDMMTDAQEGFKFVNDERMVDDSVLHVDNFINKTIEARKKRLQPQPKKIKLNVLYICLLVVLILIFIAFGLILKLN